MNSYKRLTAALVLLTAIHGHCFAQGERTQAYFADEQPSLENTFGEVLASYQCNGCPNCGSAGCDGSCGYGGCCDSGCQPCGPSGCGVGLGCPSDMSGGGCWQPFVGADYLYVRASFSEANAFATTSIPGPADDPNIRSTTFHQMDFDYESSYRIYGGVRNCCCGMEIRFDFMHLNSESDATRAPDIQNDFLVNIPLEPQGQEFFIRGDVDLRSYDLSCAKTIPLGSPLCCDCGCGDCCDGCGDCCGCWCPAWDLTFEAGVRVAEVSWERAIVGIDNGNQVNTAAISSMDFEGVGLRFGLGGRRYFGKSGLFSAFLNGDISLLAGDVEIVDSRVQNTGTVPSQLISRRDATFRNIIPVTEIEAGVTGHLTAKTSVSAGYMLSAWHDLGMRQIFNPDTDLGIQGYDDANILGFDGFFANIETVW